MKKIGLFLLLTLNTACLHAHLSEIDSLMKQAYHDAVKENLFKTESFKQKDRHKRKISCEGKACTVTVEFDYQTAPAAIKKVAEKTVTEENKQAEDNIPWYQVSSPLLLKVDEPIIFDENTFTQCTVHWKRGKESESKIVCSLTAALSELINPTTPPGKGLRSNITASAFATKAPADYVVGQEK